MSSNRLTALIIVALIHLVVGYMLVTGLAYSAYKQAIKHMTTVDVKEPEKKPPPPPPPPKNAPPPPPIVAPPPPINIAPAPPPVQTVAVAPPPVPVLAPPSAPPAPPPPKFTPKGATPRTSIGGWISDDDYPAAADRERRQGVTGVTMTIGPDGRITGCTVTSSSGSPDLDETACKLLPRRGRFNPATDGNGNPTSSSYSTRIVWKLPAEE